MTRISVIIPTRNRAHLLRTALQSVTEQVGFDGFEVVVSDNSLDQSAEAVAAEFAGPKVRYVPTGEDLDVYGSWNFALSQAKGEYSLLLADDDCLLPDALSKIARTLDRHRDPDYLGLASCWYSHRSRKMPPHNAMRFDLKWDKAGRCNPRELLEEFFRFGRPSFSPTYTVVSTRIRDTLVERGIRPYTPVYPDFAYQAFAFALADTAAVMREPTVVHGYAAESLGEQAFGKREKVAWNLTVGDGALFELSPLGGYYFINGWLETLLCVQRAIPAETEGVGIGWGGFIERYGTEIFFDGKWRDIRPDFAEYVTFLGGLPDDVRDTVLAQCTPVLRCLERMVSSRAWDKLAGHEQEWIQGEEFEFDDILSGARRATALYRERKRSQDVMQYVLGEDMEVGR